MSIFDFLKKKKYKSMRDRGFIFSTAPTTGLITVSGGVAIGETKKVKTDAKPIDVWELLKTSNDEPFVDCSDLDNKIAIIKDRIKILKDYAKGELTEEEQCLAYLEARKKYDKYKKDFAYPTTTDAMIKELCDVYTLKTAQIHQYSGTMPKEAIDELAKYKNSFKKITNGVPYVQLIVKEEDIKIEGKKRDPILLAESPFGNWWYILGAWDKEVLIVDELIYDGK